ncbi:DUF6227 family protein [Streptomyces sp. B6B3]|uniref:DUF6227 family protein n=1 Tax=Streptomyces sp. B6B3 TaxID=3153570 RepID=UPI00325CE196
MEQRDAWPERAVPSVEELEALLNGSERRDWESRLPGRPEYPGRDAAEHARRLLRRAVNADRPDEETLRLLATSTAYDIERLPDPGGSLTSAAWCAVYEHAFLLDDGREICLYELEHDLTPDRRLVCEVYADELTAGRAARRCVRPLRDT